MDGTRFPTQVHIECLERNSGSILSLFSLLLTNVAYPNEELEDFFSHQIWELEKKIKQLLKTC